MASILSKFMGVSGRRYILKQVIQERPHIGRVWLATSGAENFVLKSVPQAIHSSFIEDILPQLGKSRFLRLPWDTIPGQRIYVYKYMDDDLLSLVRKGVSITARKRILKDSLQGIAELHSQDIAHLDVKPDNIMINYRSVGSEMIVEDVQIIDLENAAYLPKGRCIKGMLAGNESWRSPEGHFKGELNKPSDIFSFAVVCIYAMLGKVIFGTDEDLQRFEARGVFPHIIRLQRQVSFSGDEEGLNGLKAYVGDEGANRQVLELLWDDRAADYHSYRAISTWPNVSDEVFKDLIAGMTNLDPRKRTTAKRALSHPWFGEV